MTKSEVTVEAETVVSDTGTTEQIVVTDRGNSRAWTGVGATIGEAATKAVRKFLDDRRAREYVG